MIADDRGSEEIARIAKSPEMPKFEKQNLTTDEHG
jgi:hypothetical protein